MLRVTSVIVVFGALAAPLNAAFLRLNTLVRDAHLESYSFLQFTQQFNRNYKVNSAEYHKRNALFQTSLNRVRSLNIKNAVEGRAWKAGIHQFMDWTAPEQKTLFGYKPSRSLRPVGALAELQTSSTLRSNATMRLKSFDHGDTIAIRDQGDCGSCWAISAVEAVEGQLQRQGVDSGVQLSASALVDCVPNPQHCGGTGGCDGATGELAFGFMRDYGIPTESELAYTPHTESCPVALDGQPWPATKGRVKVAGWNALPSNQADPLMQAIVEQGPVAVAVDAANWMDYDSGIFDNCDKDAILSHAVLAKGYGEDGGKKYWRIQNSWGRNWGEHGHIRIKRHEDESNYCGTDSKPAEGLGCDGGPASVTVCGMCGILYDPLVPTGASYEGGAAASSPSTSDLATPAMDAAIAANAEGSAPADTTQVATPAIDAAIAASTEGSTPADTTQAPSQNDAEKLMSDMLKQGN